VAAHGGVAHLARRGQAVVARGSDQLRTEARLDRGPPGGFNARSSHMARRRGERTRNGQSCPARPINTRRVAG
jgi:hypothetical protein